MTERPSGIMPIARELGDYFGAKPIEQPKPVETSVYQLRRKDLWPPDVLAEMAAIYEGKKL